VRVGAPRPEADLTGALGGENVAGEDERRDPGSTELPEKALAFARGVHAGQVDRFGRDFILHPIAVAELALPFAGPEGLVPAYLHDTVEKAGAVSEEIEELFGAETRRMVETLGQDSSIADPAARRDDHRRRLKAAGTIEKTVYLSDRRDGIITLTELVRAGRDPLEFGGTERLELWKGDLEAIGPDGIDPALIDQLGFELELLADLLREFPPPS